MLHLITCHGRIMPRLAELLLLHVDVFQKKKMLDKCSAASDLGLCCLHRLLVLILTMRWVNSADDMSPPFRVRRNIAFDMEICLSVCLSITKSFLPHNLKTIRDILMKLYRTIYHNMYRTQEP